MRDFNGFVCPTNSLDAPNPAADSIMARHARRYLDMLVPDPADGSITERARRCIYLLLPIGRATRAESAAARSLSTLAITGAGAVRDGDVNLLRTGGDRTMTRIAKIVAAALLLTAPPAFAQTPPRTLEVPATASW